jgi:DNA relaxase NicK
LEIFVSPTRYFKGAYPTVFAWLSGGASLIKTFQAKHRIVFDQAIKYAKRQVGRLVRYCSEVMRYSPEQIINDFQAESGLYPVRLFVIDDKDLDICWDWESNANSEDVSF